MEGEDEVEEETGGEGVEVEPEEGAFLEQPPEGFLVVEALEEEGVGVEAMVVALW